MSRNVNDIIPALNSAQRKKVEARAAELIAEEMTLQELRRARKPFSWYHPGQRFTTREAQRYPAFHIAQDRPGDGREPLTRG